MSGEKNTMIFSITESYHPMYRKGELKHLDNMVRHTESILASDNKNSNIDPLIYSIFQHLNSCIASLEDLFKTRMQVHEEEIIQIAHSEIRKMQEQSEKVIQRYSNLINQRNISHELLDLKYQILYFQKRACEMFEENKALKQTIKKLKDQIVMLKIAEQSDHIALRNISKKYLKEKTLKQKMLSHQLERNASLCQRSNQKMDSLTKMFNFNPEDSSPKRCKLTKQFVSPGGYFSSTESRDTAKNVKIKLNNLRPKQKVKTQPY